MKNVSFKEGEPIYCTSKTEYDNIIKNLLALGYGLSVEPHNRVITILSTPRRDNG